MKTLDQPDLRSEASRRWRLESSPAPIASLEFLDLSRRSVCSFQLSENETCQVSMRRGIAWVTLEDDSTDFILDGPGTTEFTGPGRLVIEAVEDTLVGFAILKSSASAPS